VSLTSTGHVVVNLLHQASLCLLRAGLAILAEPPDVVGLLSLLVLVPHLEEEALQTQRVGLHVEQRTLCAASPYIHLHQVAEFYVSSQSAGNVLIVLPGGGHQLRTAQAVKLGGCYTGGQGLTWVHKQIGVQCIFKFG
jgi:hypothetical protein